MTETPLEKFEKFLNIVRGRKDVKSRVAVLANPDNWKSMSVLTPSQAEFVTIAFFSAQHPKWGTMFEPLKEVAQLTMEVSPSKGGLGREQSIRFVGALSESKLLSKLGVTAKGEDKKT